MSRHEKQRLFFPLQLPKRFSAFVIFTPVGVTPIIAAYFSTLSGNTALARAISSFFSSAEGSGYSSRHSRCRARAFSSHASCYATKRSISPRLARLGARTIISPSRLTSSARVLRAERINVYSCTVLTSRQEFSILPQKVQYTFVLPAFVIKFG